MILFVLGFIFGFLAWLSFMWLIAILIDLKETCHLKDACDSQKTEGHSQNACDPKETISDLSFVDKGQSPNKEKAKWTKST